MHKTALPMLTLITALLHMAGAAQAQAPSFDIAPECSEVQAETIIRAVDGALQRLNVVDNVLATAPDQFNAAFAKAFGSYEIGSAEWEGAGLLFSMGHVNIRALLTNTPGVTIGSGPAPMWPRVRFVCARYQRADFVAERNDREIILYPVFFDDDEVPDTGRWGNVRASRVGLVLHESIHLVGGKADIRDGGILQDVQAEKLASDRDPRALTNAANYEMFYMSYPFQPL